jgi:hypothetical protein
MNTLFGQTVLFQALMAVTASWTAISIALPFTDESFSIDLDFGDT